MVSFKIKFILQEVVMRRKAVKSLIIFMVAALLIGIGSFAFADTRGEVKEFNGTVSFRYGGGFFLNTDADEEYKLVLGPPWYLDNLGLKLKNGDRVTVQGVYERGILFVGTLKQGSKTYDIANLEDMDKYFCHDRYGRGMMSGPGRGPGMRHGESDDRPYSRGWRK